MITFTNTIMYNDARGLVVLASPLVMLYGGALIDEDFYFFLSMNFFN